MGPSKTRSVEVTMVDTGTTDAPCIVNRLYQYTQSYTSLI